MLHLRTVDKIMKKVFVSDELTMIKEYKWIKPQQELIFNVSESMSVWKIEQLKAHFVIEGLALVDMVLTPFTGFVELSFRFAGFQDVESFVVSRS